MSPASISVDCPSAGNCSAGGPYAPGSNNHSAGREAFLVSEKHGVWGQARKIAGLAKLNTGGGDGGPDAGFGQISCSSAGNCLAAGSYDGKKGTEPFTVTEQHGTWGPARRISPHHRDQRWRTRGDHLGLVPGGSQLHRYGVLLLLRNRRRTLRLQPEERDLGPAQRDSGHAASR